MTADILTTTSEGADLLEVDEAGLEQAGEKFKFLCGKLLNFD